MHEPDNNQAEVEVVVLGEWHVSMSKKARLGTHVRLLPSIPNPIRSLQRHERKIILEKVGGGGGGNSDGADETTTQEEEEEEEEATALRDGENIVLRILKKQKSSNSKIIVPHKHNQKQQQNDHDDDETNHNNNEEENETAISSLSYFDDEEEDDEADDYDNTDQEEFDTSAEQDDIQDHDDDNTTDAIASKDNSGDKWKELYRYRLNDVTVKSRHQAKIQMEFLHPHEHSPETRDFIFASSHAAEQFAQAWERSQQQAKARAIHQLETYMTEQQEALDKKKLKTKQHHHKHPDDDDDDDDDKNNGENHAQQPLESTPHDDDAATMVTETDNLTNAVGADILDTHMDAKDIIEGNNVNGSTGQVLTTSKKKTNGSKDDDDDEEKLKIRLLFDIVSGSNLPIKDPLKGSSDPFVVVYMQGQQVHQTQHIGNTVNPIWTLKTSSLFLLEMPMSDFFLAHEMTLVIKDHDAMNTNDVMGTIKIPIQDLLHGKGERHGYEVQTKDRKTRHDDKNNNGSTRTPMLYVRYKKATTDDIKFMEAYTHHGYGVGLYADEVYLPLRKQCSTTLKRMHKYDENNIRRTRVMPGPNPDAIDNGAMWMTSEQIQQEALKESTNWIQAGSGEMGTLYFELIGCDNLPDMDSVIPGDGQALSCVKIDTFGCIVFEDSVVNTDVIPNCSSPRWMPWTNRAFKFQMTQPSADVFLGIFDHDNAYNPAQVVSRVSRVSTLHDPAGRVIIELSKLLPDTTYLLKYPLYYGETQDQRVKPRGSVTVRLRMEFPSTRKMLLSALSPPKNNVIALRKKSEWSVAHYTVEGAVDDDRFSISTMTRYLEELEAYLTLLDDIKNALWNVWLWRGHYKASVCGREVELPLHSITAYIWAIQLSWNYDLLPSFILFCVGWFMLACQEHRNRHPSRWRRSPSYFNFLRRLILDKSVQEKIKSGEKANVVRHYEEQQEKERKERQRKRQLEQAEQMKIEEEVRARVEQADKAERSMADQSEGIFGINVRPLKPILYPYQKMMRQYILQGRLAGNIIMWNQSYYSFWITTFAFLLSAVAFFIPWSFLVTWGIRIVVIVFLGPWMKIVDLVFFRADPNLSVEEQEEAFAKKMKDQYEDAIKSTDFYQIRTERATKLNDMRQFMFGMHLLRVPLLKDALCLDVPTTDSSAEPYSKNNGGNSEIQVKGRKFGQFLEGDMIPKRELELEKQRARSNTYVGKKLLSGGQKAIGATFGTAVRMPTKVLGGAFSIGKNIGKNVSKGDLGVPLLRRKAISRHSVVSTTTSTDGNRNDSGSGFGSDDDQD